MSIVEPMIASTFAPAKINLFLETPSLRADGYHEIDTVMVPIDCGDDVEVRIEPGEGITIDCRWTDDAHGMKTDDWHGDKMVGNDDGGRSSSRIWTKSPTIELPADESNLAYIAAERFMEAHGIRARVRITIAKRTPAGAGMGGASSDAAAVLRCLAAASGVNEPSTQSDIAASIGSDVAFFLGVPKFTAARATGRGEQIEPLAMREPIHFIVVHPGQSLSTASVYGRNEVPAVAESPLELIRWLANPKQNGGFEASSTISLHNRLTQPAIKICPLIRQILEILDEATDSFSPPRMIAMTGSGSACFAVVDDAGQASDVVRQLQSLSPSNFWIGQFRAICGHVAVAIR